MSDNSLIEWTDATWNPITGCSVVSPGCTNCYAMRLAGGRLQHHPSRQGLTRESKAGPVWNGEVRFNAETLLHPLGWTRPRKIFVCAHGDLFAEGVPDEWIDQVFAVMALCPQHIFQVLTKRPERMRDYMRRLPTRRDAIGQAAAHLWGAKDPDGVYDVAAATVEGSLDNVWLGVSVEDQKRADERIPLLLDTPRVAIRFVSIEPLLGPIDLTRLDADGEGECNGLAPDNWEDIWSACWSPEVTGIPLKQARLDFFDWYGMAPADDLPPGPAHHRIDWVIVGGESGKGARPMHPDWARKLRDQCADAGVPFFFKQWGAWAPGEWWLDLEDRVTFLPLDKSVAVKGLGDHEKAQHRVHWWEDDKVPEGLGSVLVGKDLAGRKLDGVECNAMPEASS